MKFIITVDVEAENQWKEDAPKTILNVFKLSRFHELARRFGFKPTYLVTYEVAENPDAVLLLKKWSDSKEAEVGAHLHPWTTPPIGEMDKFKRFPSELKDNELKAKLVSLNRRIKESFGRSPTSYRAGRWGFDHRQREILAELGYKADCSVTPLITWKNDMEGPGLSGPDWGRENAHPQKFSENGKVLVEVPMTILNTGILGDSRFLLEFVRAYPHNLISRAMRKFLLRPLWLRIFPETSPDTWTAILKTAKQKQLPNIEFMIHSSELVSGGSPYVKNEATLDKLYGNLRLLFEFCQENGLEGATLSEFAESFADTA